MKQLSFFPTIWHCFADMSHYVSLSHFKANSSRLSKQDLRMAKVYFAIKKVKHLVHFVFSFKLRHCGRFCVNRDGLKCDYTFGGRMCEIRILTNVFHGFCSGEVRNSVTKNITKVESLISRWLACMQKSG